MTTPLEIAAGLVLSGCMVTALTVLAAFELGRLVSRERRAARGRAGPAFRGARPARRVRG